MKDGYWIQNSGYWVLDSGFKVFGWQQSVNNLLLPNERVRIGTKLGITLKIKK